MCGRPIARQTPDQIVDQILELPAGTRFQLLAPVVRGRKGEYEALLRRSAKELCGPGVDGEVRDLSEPIGWPRPTSTTSRSWSTASSPAAPRPTRRPAAAWPTRSRRPVDLSEG